MKSHTPPTRSNLFDGQSFDWNEFQDETLQFDTWNMNFDDDEESDSGSDRNDDSDRDDGDPNRYLG